MYAGRHAARFGAYAAACAAVATRSRWFLGAAAIGGLVYASKPLRRAWGRMSGRPAARVASVGGVPAAMVFLDLAKMWGYLIGLVSKLAPRN
jgi:hypothetical protein